MTITIEDLRKCGQGKINRKITAIGPNGIQVTTTQTILVVGCEAHYPIIKIISGTSSDPNNGTAVIQLNADLHSNCYSERLISLTYEIDEFNDGSGKYNGFDYKVGPLSAAERILGITPQFTDNPRAFQINTSDASERYPFGIHRIRWKAEDDCGNISYAEQLFETKDIVATHNTTSDNQLQIIPNPSNGNVLISSEKEIDKIKLITGIGSVYQEYKIENKHNLALSNLPGGVYWILAYKDEVMISIGKMVIIH